MSALDPAQSEGRWSLYRLLADATRLRLLALAAERELTVGELADVLDESQPNVSRQVGMLRQGSLLSDRRDGTRTYVRIASAARKDLVVCDAVAEGRRLCQREGRIERLAGVLDRRQGTRATFDGAAPAETVAWLAPELPMYVKALSLVLGERDFALDVNAGAGGMLDVLAPTFRRVMAVARSGGDWERASRKVRYRGYDNVELLRGDLEERELRRHVSTGASAVFASRLLHRTEKPRVLLAGLATLLAPGGQLLLLDFDTSHEDASRGEQRDSWLGFPRQGLTEMLQAAGLVASMCLPIPRGFTGDVLDAGSQGTWQIVRAMRPKAPNP